MEVAGFKKTFSLDQGSILGNDQTFQALYNAPLSDDKRSGICVRPVAGVAGAADVLPR